MDAQLIGIDEVSKILNMSESTIRRKIPLKLVPKPIKRLSDREPLKWRKADIAKFAKTDELNAANDDQYLSIDLMIEKIVEIKVNSILNQRIEEQIARRLNELNQNLTC